MVAKSKTIPVKGVEVSAVIGPAVAVPGRVPGGPALVVLVETRVVPADVVLDRAVLEVVSSGAGAGVDVVELPVLSWLLSLVAGNFRNILK